MASFFISLNHKHCYLYSLNNKSKPYSTEQQKNATQSNSIQGNSYRENGRDFVIDCWLEELVLGPDFNHLLMFKSLVGTGGCSENLNGRKTWKQNGCQSCSRSFRLPSSFLWLEITLLNSLLHHSHNHANCFIPEKTHSVLLSGCSTEKRLSLQEHSVVIFVKTETASITQSST